MVDSARGFGAGVACGGVSVAAGPARGTVGGGPVGGAPVVSTGATPLPCRGTHAAPLRMGPPATALPAPV